MKTPEQFKTGSVDKVERAQALMRRIGVALGSHAADFEANGIEVAGVGTRLTFRKDGVELLMIDLYAINDYSHFLVKSPLISTDRRRKYPSEIYQTEEALISEIIPTLERMIQFLYDTGRFK